MRKIFIVSFFVLAILSCSPKAAPSIQEPKTGVKESSGAPVSVQSGWQAEWEKVLKEARKEGKVVVMATFGNVARQALVEAFHEKFGIALDMVVGRGGGLSAKVLAERRAGLYTLDVYTGGTTDIINGLKPSGSLDPILPALILPEVLDPNVWWEKRLPIVADNEKKYIFSYTAQTSWGGLVINPDRVKKSEFSSYYDLLQPKYIGKIVSTPFWQSGSALKWFGVVLTARTLNVDYFKELVKQEVVFTDNERQGVEWIARGKYLVGMFLGQESTQVFRDAGFNIDDDIFLKEDVARISYAGAGNLVLMNKAPHPNAAKIFINWLLSKEGSYIKNKASGHLSARIDVPTDYLSPKKLRNPNLPYFGGADHEDFIIKQPEHASLAAEIFLQTPR